MEETQAKLRGHKFLPDTPLPALYTTEDTKVGDKVIVLRYFIANSQWNVVEVNREEDLAFGWVILNGNLSFAEWGYISLTELEAVNVRNRVVERDINFLPTIARECLPSEAWEWHDN